MISKEGKFTLLIFPDCPGCQTQADPGELIEVEAAEALQGWLETHLLDGEAPPRLSARTRPVRKGEKLHWIEVVFKVHPEFGLPRRQYA